METPFEGTVLENITFKKRTVSEETLKWAIEGGMQKRIHKVAGSQTQLFSEGKQLSSSNAQNTG
jgi:ABC-type transport system involved in cytochrome bd biosynthesis fused ATPase/permease subunit